MGYLAMLWFMVTARDEGEVAENMERRDVVQRIAVTYMVTLSSIGDFKARGPAFLRDAVGWARPVSGGLNLGFYPIRCSFGLGYFFQTWGTVLMPLVLFLSFGMVEQFRLRVLGRARDQFTASLWTCGVLVSYLMYPAVLETLLSGTYVACVPVSLTSVASIYVPHP
jgi:hypothetical protein